MNKGAPAGKTR